MHGAIAAYLMAFRMAVITLREERSADLWRQRRAKRSRNVLTRLFRVDCNSQVALASAEQERSGSRQSWWRALPT